MQWAKQKSGFTIVELLIVVVVIAILAAITIVSFNGIQGRARDSERVSDISSIQKKLELFYAENGYYPNSTQMSNVPFRRDTLQIDDNTWRSPSGSAVGYCWASNTDMYCYVARRPSGGPAGDCTGSTDPVERCVNYQLSYRKEAEPNTMIRVYSLSGQ